MPTGTGSRYKLKPPPCNNSEEELQDAVVDRLRLLGFYVFEIGRWRKQCQCPKCDHWFTPHNGMPNTPNSPDLIITRPGKWHPHVAVLVELKKEPDSRKQKGVWVGQMYFYGQQELADNGITTICWTTEMVMKAIEAFEKTLKGRET